MCACVCVYGCVSVCVRAYVSACVCVRVCVCVCVRRGPHDFIHFFCFIQIMVVPMYGLVHLPVLYKRVSISPFISVIYKSVIHLFLWSVFPPHRTSKTQCGVTGVGLALHAGGSSYVHTHTSSNPQNKTNKARVQPVHWE